MVLRVLLVFLDSSIDVVELFDGSVGHGLNRPDRRDLFVQSDPLRPPVAQGKGQVGDAGEMELEDNAAGATLDTADAAEPGAATLSATSPTRRCRPTS